jgi:hypothetical protein
MQAKLIITFGPLSGADFLTKAGTIVAALRDNPDFPEPWPPQVCSFAQLEAAYIDFRDALHASANRDRTKIAERDAAREVLTAMLKRLAAYLELVAQGDTKKLLRTGYDLRKDNAHGSGSGPLPAPTNFTLKRSDISGTLILHAASVYAAASYEVDIADSEPTAEGTWRDAGTFATCSHIEVPGLTPGKVYWARLRAIGVSCPGAWTDPVSLMVV